MSLFRVFGASPSTEREEEKPELAHFDAHAVLTAAGVLPEHRERVERAIVLLRSLPAETPADVGKQIVEASLTAFDISVSAIVDAATAEVAAYDAFIASGHKQLDEVTKLGESRIAQLEADIAKVRKQLEVASFDQACLDKAAIEASERIRPVLRFFGEPVAVSEDVALPASVQLPEPREPQLSAN